MPSKSHSDLPKWCKRHLSIHWLGIFSASVLLIFTGLHIDRLYNEKHHQQQRAEVIAELSLVQTRLEEKIVSNMQTVQGIVAAIVVEPDMTQERFKLFTAPVINNQSQVISVAASPSLVVGMVYPTDGVEHIFGLDLRKDARFREPTLKVKNYGKPILAGPMDLFQGVRGFICRIPVYTHSGDDKTFWGIVSAVIHQERLFEASGLYNEGTAIDIAIRNTEKNRTSKTPSNVFFGKPNIFTKKPVTMNISIPGGSWQIAATPKNGWAESSPDQVSNHLAFLAIFAAIIIPLILITKSAQKRRHQQLLLQGLFDLSPVGITLATFHKHKFIDANPSALAIFGCSKDQFLQSTYDTLTPKRYADSDREHIIQMNKTGKFGPYEKHMFRADGSEFPVVLSSQIIEDETGEKMVWSIFEDISARREAERKLVKAKEDAELAVKVKSEFLAMMSHEIRTPMNGVIGMLNILKRSELDESQHHKLDIAKFSADSLLTIINDILDFSKVDAGKMDIESIEFNITDLLGDFSESIALKAQEKGIEMILDTVDIDQDLVKGDPSRIRQILNNIAGNAVKFTAEGEIVICCKLKMIDEQLELHVSVNDTGVGIPEQKLQTLFTPFTQVDASTTRKYGGTGLGLAISKKLCEQMGGRISVISSENIGSCFSFSVQLTPSRHPNTLKPDFDITGKNILVIAKNQLNAVTIAKQLSCWGATCMSTTNSNAAIEAAGTRASDIYILDQDLVNSSGLKVARELRELTGAPIVVMADMSHAFHECDLQELNIGATLPKPLIYRDFLAIVHILELQANSQQPFCHLNVIRKEHEKAILNTQKLSQKTNNILLAEDNPVNQQVAEAMLRRLNMTVRVADDGGKVLSALQSAEEDEVYYDAILMDCHMPVLDGYQTTEAIRKGKAGQYWRNIPIIAMTANAMKGDKEKCINFGMDDYISKPINEEALLNTLSQWIDNKDNPEQRAHNQSL